MKIKRAREIQAQGMMDMFEGKQLTRQQSLDYVKAGKVIQQHEEQKKRTAANKAHKKSKHN